MKLSRTLPLLGIGAASVLAGCGSSHHTATAPTSALGTVPATSVPATTSPTTAAPAATVAPTTTPPTTAAPSTTAPGSGSSCATSSLTGRLTNPSGAAGTTYYSLELTNSGSTTCTISGYAGVSYVTNAAGTQVGAAARRDPGTVATVTLAPGKAAVATLGLVEAGNYGPSCGQTPVAGLRVFPPNQTQALYVPHLSTGCSNSSDVVLHVGPFRAA